MARNAGKLPVGAPVPGWTPRPAPPATAMAGRTCRVEPLDPDAHGPALWRAFSVPEAAPVWTYLGYGPFESEADYRARLAAFAAGTDPLFFAIVEAGSGAPRGLASFLRIDPANGVVEIGHICLAPALQRTPAATEAIALMLGRVFDDLGYRRCEWKCDALNAASRRAAVRFGFTFEGVFRQAAVVKGRNRDTAWYAMLDREWPARKARLAAWLDPSNFDAAGRQRRALSAFPP